MRKLTEQPLIDPSAQVKASTLGRYTEVGARTRVLESELGDYSYIVNDGDMAYTAVGKFCSIAAMTRINPGNHPMWRASQAHFTYRASAYFDGEADEDGFFDWRRSHRVILGNDNLDRAWRRPSCRDAASATARSSPRSAIAHQGRAGLRDRRRQPGAGDQASLPRGGRAAPFDARLVELEPRRASSRAIRFSRRCRSKGFLEK